MRYTHRIMQFSMMRRIPSFAVIMIGSLLIILSGAPFCSADEKKPTKKTSHASARTLEDMAGGLKLPNTHQEDGSSLVIDNAKLKEIGANGHLSKGGSLGGDSKAETISDRQHPSARRAPGSRGLNANGAELQPASVAANLSTGEIKRAIKRTRRAEAEKRLRALNSGPVEKMELRKQIETLQKRRAAMEAALLSKNQGQQNSKQ